MYSLSTMTGITKWTIGGAEHVAWMVYTVEKCIYHFCYKILQGRSSYKWEDNMQMDLKNRGWKSADWILLPQFRFQCVTVPNRVMNFNVL